MGRGEAFARDWQLLKLSRSWRPHDLSAEILSLLLDSGSEAVQEGVREAACHLGEREAWQFLERMPAGMNPVTVLESFFLISGIWCESRQEDGRAVLWIKKECGNILDEATCTGPLAAAFLSGYISAIVNGAGIEEQDEYLVVRVTPPP